MKMNAYRWLLLLAAGLLLLLGSGLHADTIITDPKGMTLCLGKTVVSVNLERVNYDPRFQKFPELKDCSFLIMGMMDGRVVGADCKQEPSRPTYNKLFYITLLGDGKASYSGLVEDQIPIRSGAKSLKDFVKKDVLLNSYSRIRGQLLPWEATRKDGTSVKYVMMIDGYAQSISLFTLNDVPAPASGDNLHLRELVYSRELILPSSSKPYQNYFINAIDCIDLNAFREPCNPLNTNDYPMALMVWCKPDRNTGYELMSLDAPSDALTCSLNENLTTIKIESEDGFALDVYSSKNFNVNQIVGGFLTAPDETGKLCYWCEKLIAGYTAYYGVTQGYYTFQIHKKPIVYTPPSTTSPKGIIKTEISTSNCEWNKQDKDHQPVEWWNEISLQNPGPKISIDKDAGKKVHIKPAVVDDCEIFKTSKLSSGSNFIGILEETPKADIDKINKNIEIFGGKIPNLDLKLRLNRVARVEGWTILRVLLGQPYVAGPTPPSSTWEYKADRTRIQQYSFNNGFSTKDSFGIKMGKDDLGSRSTFVSFESGVKGEYEYKYTRATNDEVIASAGYKLEVKTERAYSSGAVFYTALKPQIYSMGRILPNKDAQYLTVSGAGNDRFNLWIMNVIPQVGNKSSAIRQMEFLCENPAKTAGDTLDQYRDREDQADGESVIFETDYAVLSDGLLARPYSSLIMGPESGLKQLLLDRSKQITDWERTNNIIQDIESFYNGGGVQSYSSYATHQNLQDWLPLDGSCVATPFNISSTYSISYKSEDKNTRSHQGAVGFYWKLTLANMFNYEGEKMYKGGEERVNSDSEKTQYTVTVPGYPGINLNKNRSYYYYWVDVPSMKSWMASHSYTLSTGENKGSYTNELHRPSFIPVYAWDNNQSFMLGVPWLEIGVNSKNPNKPVPNPASR